MNVKSCCLSNIENVFGSRLLNKFGIHTHLSYNLIAVGGKIKY